MEDDLDEQIRIKKLMIENLEKENKKIEKKIEEKKKEKEAKSKELKKLEDEFNDLKKKTNIRNEEYIRNKKDIKQELIEPIINEFKNLYEDENKDIRYYSNRIIELQKQIEVINKKIEKEKNK